MDYGLDLGLGLDNKPSLLCFTLYNVPPPEESIGDCSICNNIRTGLHSLYSLRPGSGGQDGDKFGTLNIVRAQIQIGPRILSNFPIVLLFCDSEICGESVRVSELSPGYKSYKSQLETVTNTTTHHIPNETPQPSLVTGHPNTRIPGL